MIDTLVAGGPVMIPIALCSVVAILVFLERTVALRRGAVVPTSFVVELVELIRQGRHDDALTHCRKHDRPAARILEAAVASRKLARAEIKERMEEVGRREAADLERFLPILGTIAGIAPLLGMLGTVLGMIFTFRVLQEAGGTADVAQLAGGISQALVTTFAGLSVGIPALIVHRWLLARVDGLLLDLEEAGLTVLDHLVTSEHAG